MPQRSRILIVQHEDGTEPGLVGDRLAAAGADLDLRHPWQGDALPKDLSEHDALLVLGGSQGANDPIAWWPEVFELLREAVQRDVPTLGICLGAQLLAVACGGEVRRAAGPEVGLCELTGTRAAADDPLFGTLPVMPRAVQWHWDEVTRLPEGAERLMQCPDFPNQAYRIGRRVWAVQFHPEVLIADAERWAAGDRLDGLDAAAILGGIEAADDELRRVWGPFAERWLALVADPDLL